MKKIQKTKKKSKKSKKSDTQEFQKQNKKPPKIKRKVIDPNLLIPSGSTIFNLSCSDRIEGAYQLGKYSNLIGDSESGKSFLAWTMLAECANDSRFDKYKLIYRDNENAGEFDIPFLFGEIANERIENDEDSVPETVEQMADEINDLLDAKVPFIYIADSLDSLTSDAEIEGENENRKKRAKGQKADGSYGMDKQKFLSKFFRTNKKKLKKANSAVIIISQTRDNIGFGAMFAPKTRSGGKALKFYCTHETWVSSVRQDKGGGKRRIATDICIKITKNKLTGRKGEALYTNIQDYGIDDIGSCIDFMLSEGSWTGNKVRMNVDGFLDIPKVVTVKGKKTGGIKYKELIKKIEKENLHDELKQAVQIAYNEILANLMPDRKRKYE